MQCSLIIRNNYIEFCFYHMLLCARDSWKILDFGGELRVIGGGGGGPDVRAERFISYAPTRKRDARRLTE